MRSNLNGTLPIHNASDPCFPSVVSVPREDARAYTAEHRASVARAPASPDIPGVTEADLEAINAVDDPEAAARELIARRLHA